MIAGHALLTRLVAESLSAMVRRRAYATEGEIRGAMREVFGDHVEGTEF